MLEAPKHLHCSVQGGNGLQYPKIDQRRTFSIKVEQWWKQMWKESFEEHSSEAVRRNKITKSQGNNGITEGSTFFQQDIQLLVKAHLCSDIYLVKLYSYPSCITIMKWAYYMSHRNAWGNLIIIINFDIY